MDIKYIRLNKAVKAYGPERPPTAKGMKLCPFNLLQLSGLHIIFFSAYEGLRFPPMHSR